MAASRKKGSTPSLLFSQQFESRFFFVAVVQSCFVITDLNGSVD